MADSVKNTEPDFIAGKFADIDYTGVEHQILAFDTFQQAFHSGWGILWPHPPRCQLLPT